MSDLGKITSGFNTHEIRVDSSKGAEQIPQDIEQSDAKGESLAEVRSAHFIPGQSQVGTDNFAHDMKILSEHPEIVETSNDIYDKVYEDYISMGYSETDASGMAANVQAAFVEELLN